jgi:hypothetical protein
VSAFDSPLANLVASVSATFADTITWSPQLPSLAPYTLSACVDIGDATEKQSAGMFIVLRNVKLSDLAVALNGRTDLSKLDGDQVTLGSTIPAWMQGTYRVQNVTDPDFAGTVEVELRKPRQSGQ